jgi:hypothetical protein
MLICVYIKFEVVMVVKIQIMAFGAMTPYILLRVEHSVFIFMVGE